LTRFAASQEDGAELAVVLKRALAGRPLADAPDGEIAAALRDFERRRSARCGSLIAQARTTGRRNVPSRTWLVRPLPSLPGSGARAPRWPVLGVGKRGPRWHNLGWRACAAVLPTLVLPL